MPPPSSGAVAAARRAQSRLRMAKLRARQTEAERVDERWRDARRRAAARAAESQAARQQRLARDAAAHAAARDRAQPEKQQQRQIRDAAAHAEARRRRLQRTQPLQLARGYTATVLAVPREGRQGTVSGHCGVPKGKVVPEKAGTDNNPSEAESEDVVQIKSEPEDGNCDDRADVLPENDCDSEPDTQPGVKSADNLSVITDTRRCKCELCDYSGKNIPNLKLLMKFHTGSRPFQCDICPMAFEQHDNLVAHRRTHPKETGRKRTYRCSRCREQFTSLEMFKHHKITHIKKKIHACKLCPKRFTHPGTLGRHIVDNHKQNYRCNRCGKGFVSSGWHKKHQASCCESVLETASDESPEQQARMDKVQFEKLSSEPVSADVFSTESTTGTQTCLDSTQPREEYITESVGAKEASFQQHGQLIAHRPTHPKETKGSKRTNYCTLCREQFTSRETFEHHMEAHTQDKPYGCNECPKRFAHVANLSRHVVNKHTQNFRCDQCGKGFVTSVWHTKHQASCFVDQICVLETGFGECSEQQATLSRMDYANCDKVSCQTASADVFSTESSTGPQTCLDSSPPREDHATDSVGAGQAYCFDLADSVPVDSWRNCPKVDEMPPPENYFSIDSASEEKFCVDLAPEELSLDLEDKLSDDSSWEDTFSAYSALDEQPSTDPLALD